MTKKIPFYNWQPITVKELNKLFSSAPFKWGLAGGYAIEQFLGKPIREHDDIDIVVFRDEQSQVQDWLKEWKLYAADPPKQLRPWGKGEHLPIGIHDIWCHKMNSRSWQLQIMLVEVDGDTWFSRRNHFIRDSRDTFFTSYNGIPCIKVEIQLLFKAKNIRPKDNFDFKACLPFLDTNAKLWLLRQLNLEFPNDHIWLSSLQE